MVTIGGYEIESFRKLEIPINNGNLEPHVYSGKVVDVPTLLNKKTGKTECQTYEITWDRFGRCSNWNRKDCFIDVDLL